MSLGAHISRYHAPGERPSIAAHIEWARREAELEAGVRLSAAAIFVGGPKGRQITLHESEGLELRGYIARTGTRVVAHSSYSAVPWRGDPDAARFIREEAGVCQAAGIEGLVVHLPKAPAAQVLRYAGSLLNPEAPSVRLYFETPAVSPRETYYETPEKLAALFRGLRERLDPPLSSFGLCVDSAHLWTSNVDLQSYAAASDWLTRLEAAADAIPHDRVMVHLNDSVRPRGVGPDAHAPLARGKIWESYCDKLGESGLAAFTDYAQRHDTITILERKPKEALLSDYRILRELMPSVAVDATDG
jgi:endonuclease IV